MMEDRNVDTTGQQDYPADDDDNLEILRSTIRQSLTEIANDVGIGMRDAGLNFPFGLAVPNSGPSLMSMVTSDDPNDADWTRATTMVCQIVAQKLGGMHLRCRALECTMVNATMTAAKIVSNTLIFDTRL
jgi:hypothetical protein